MKKYIVSWDERHRVMVKAEDKDEAKKIVSIGDYDERDVGGEMNGSLEVEEIVE